MPVFLKDLVEGGYTDQDRQEKALSSQGYYKDKELSSAKNQIFYNPDSKTLIKNTNGTQDLGDWGTNLFMQSGLLSSTSRYKDEKNALKKAHKKHNPDKVILTGSSLGGKISADLGKDLKKQKVNVEVQSLNRASLPFEKTENYHKHYRVKGDTVSLFSANAKHTKTINSVKPKQQLIPNILPSHYSYPVNWLYNTLEAHGSQNLTDQIVI